MRKLITMAMLLIGFSASGQTQTDSLAAKVVQMQSHLNKYYQQTRTGTGLVAFGTLLGTATLIGLDRKQGEHRLRNSLYGVAGGSALLGLLINMEAIRFVRDASEVSISPGAVTIKF